MNHVPELLLDGQVDEQLGGARPALGGDVAERAPDEVAVALEGDLADQVVRRVHARPAHRDGLVHAGDELRP